MVSKAIHTSVYKIFTESEWKLFQESGQFEGSPDDLRDGFIHLCTKEQVAVVSERFFAGKCSLYVVEFSNPNFLKQLKWDATPSGDIYPHLYGSVLALCEISGFKKL